MIWLFKGYRYVFFRKEKEKYTIEPPKERWRMYTANMNNRGNALSLLFLHS